MMHRSKRHIGLAVSLFFAAPLVAEFLLGNLPIQMLGALVVLAPLYGGGALLIRESVRRTGRSWPSIVILGVCYGVFEEAFTTQSLFNPNYLGLHLHLLDPAYIPALGIGAWWTVFVLTIHTGWSICTSIALIEAFAPGNATAPWLGRTGIAITGLLFIFGAVASTLIGYKHDHFLASPAQFVSAAVICVILILIAFRIPVRRAAAGTARVPNPWLAGAFSLTLGSAILLIPNRWDWGAAIGILAVDAIAIAAILLWSRSLRWDMRHKLALAGGAALAYGWHSFFETPAVGQMSSVRVGNAIFVACAVVLITAAARKNRSGAGVPAFGRDTIVRQAD